uniref:Bifunctional polynucleotide phosphatase/kinase n=1 Tax=Loa loa TaxID=7209 RepID=A0A1I7VDI6_LOALO
MTRRACTTMLDWLTDSKKDRKDDGNGGYARWHSVGKDLMVLDFGNINHCADIAAFDFDGTVIITKSGKTFPENEDDWQFFCESVPHALTDIVGKDFKVVIFTNQRGIQKGSQDRDAFCRKMEKVCQEINIPVQVFVSLGTLQYRKPYIGMWNYFESHGNGGISVNRQSSFYVGDAAGRIQTNIRKKKDHSAADRLFALNFGIKFFTPEQYFLNQVDVEEYTLPSFLPSSLLDEKVSLFDPENTSIPGNGLEVLIFVGYPGCGKSSLAKKLAAQHGYGIVNRDTLKTWQKCVENAKILLKRQQNVIVDNTNADKESRKRYISLAKSFGAVSRCFLFNCTLEQAAHNCKYRVIIDTDEKHIEIGRMVLDGYKKKFEEPKLSEGFSSIVKVNFVPEFDCREHEAIYRMYLCLLHGQPLLAGGEGRELRTLMRLQAMLMIAHAPDDTSDRESRKAKPVQLFHNREFLCLDRVEFGSDPEEQMPMLLRCGRNKANELMEEQLNRKDGFGEGCCRMGCLALHSNRMTRLHDEKYICGIYGRIMSFCRGRYDRPLFASVELPMSATDNTLFL